MKIITFSGVDGSGKSTQLSLLQKYLQQQGKKVAYFHAIEFSLANKLARFFKGSEASQHNKAKAVTTASTFSVLLREKFLLFDLVRFSLYLWRLKRQNYEILLSDRFFYDTLINFEYLSDSPLVRLGTRCLEILLPKVDRAFYFDIAPEAIMARECPPEQGQEYLKKKQLLFRKKIQSWQLIVIDANQERNIVFSTILKKL